jgi:hypothetical protein
VPRPPVQNRGHFSRALSCLLIDRLLVGCEFGNKPRHSYKYEPSIGIYSVRGPDQATAHTRHLVLAMFVVPYIASASHGVAQSVDGTYVGERLRTKGDPSLCVDKDTVSVTIHDGTLTFTDSTTKDYTMGFSPHSDGSFVQLSGDISGAVVDMCGNIIAGVLDSDVTSADCVHHWHLKKR